MPAPQAHLQPRHEAQRRHQSIGDVLPLEHAQSARHRLHCRHAPLLGLLRSRQSLLWSAADDLKPTMRSPLVCKQAAIRHCLSYGLARQSSWASSCQSLTLLSPIIVSEPASSLLTPEPHLADEAITLVVGAICDRQRHELPWALRPQQNLSVGLHAWSWR